MCSCLTTFKITAPCPHCGHAFSDADERMLRACNRNRNWCTRRRCGQCSRNVGISYNYKGELVAFQLHAPPQHIIRQKP